MKATHHRHTLHLLALLIVLVLLGACSDSIGRRAAVIVVVTATPPPTAVPSATPFPVSNSVPTAGSPLVIPSSTSTTVSSPTAAPATPTLPPTLTPLPTWTRGAVLLPRTTPSATDAAPTATPDYPPGIYVTGIRSEPDRPSPGQMVRFLVTFVNTTREDRDFSWLVQVYVAETGKGFGETAVRRTAIPPGTTEMESADNWGVKGASPCLSLVARVRAVDVDKARIDFGSVDGSVVSYAFQVCPPP